MANEIYDSTWWGNTIDTASSIGTSTEMIQGQFNLTKLGDDLVTNGDFATDSDWNKGTGWSIGNGVATANNVPNLQRLQSSGGTSSVIGNTYKYSIEVSNVSGAYSMYIYGVYVFSSISTEGVIEGYVTATSTNGTIFINGATAQGLISATIDNVSVKQVRATTVEASKCLADTIHRIGLQDIQN